MLGLLLSFSPLIVESFFTFLSFPFFSFLPHDVLAFFFFHRLLQTLEQQVGEVSEMEEVHAMFRWFSCCGIPLILLLLFFFSLAFKVSL
jgi:hypothetical protein